MCLHALVRRNYFRIAPRSPVSALNYPSTCTTLDVCIRYDGATDVNLFLMEMGRTGMEEFEVVLWRRGATMDNIIIAASESCAEVSTLFEFFRRIAA